MGKKAGKIGEGGVKSGFVDVIYVEGGFSFFGFERKGKERKGKEVESD